MRAKDEIFVKGWLSVTGTSYKATVVQINIVGLGRLQPNCSVVDLSP